MVFEVVLAAAACCLAACYIGIVVEKCESLSVDEVGYEDFRVDFSIQSYCRILERILLVQSDNYIFEFNNACRIVKHPHNHTFYCQTFNWRKILGTRSILETSYDLNSSGRCILACTSAFTNLIGRLSRSTIWLMMLSRFSNFCLVIIGSWSCWMGPPR